MTYEEAIEKWARKQWPDIPENAYRFELDEDFDVVFRFATGYPGGARDFRSPLKLGDHNWTVREIVEIATGAEK